MKMVAKPEPRRFFYIARGRDHSLCGGVATSSGISMRNVPIWRKPGDYEWERRFGTVEKAMEYAAMTMVGAAEMFLATHQHPGALKDAVCSPGGSTIAGVRALEQHGFRAAAMDCVMATCARNKEMGKEK